MRDSWLVLAIAGSRASDMRGQASLCPQCRPPRPRHPIVGVCRRGGRLCGRHTTANCDLTARTAASLPANGGICTIRGVTRRRHADRMLLMVQNPHCAWVEVAWVPGGGGEACGLGATPFMPGHDGGNCTNRGATRRRHADRMLLMLQNPHHYPWYHAPSLCGAAQARPGQVGRRWRRYRRDA